MRVFSYTPSSKSFPFSCIFLSYFIGILVSVTPLLAARPQPSQGPSSGQSGPPPAGSGQPQGGPAAQPPPNGQKPNPVRYAMDHHCIPVVFSYPSAFSEFVDRVPNTVSLEVQRGADIRRIDVAFPSMSDVSTDAFRQFVEKTGGFLLRGPRPGQFPLGLTGVRVANQYRSLSGLIGGVPDYRAREVPEAFEWIFGLEYLKANEFRGTDGLTRPVIEVVLPIAELQADPLERLHRGPQSAFGALMKDGANQVSGILIWDMDLDVKRGLTVLQGILGVEYRVSRLK